MNELTIRPARLERLREICLALPGAAEPRGRTIGARSLSSLLVGLQFALGPSVRQILRMLLVSFSKPIVIANLAVWPVAYVVLSGYLNLFAIRSGIGAIPFVLSLLMALAVAWLALAAQATRAARASPSVVLRRE